MVGRAVHRLAVALLLNAVASRAAGYSAGAAPAIFALHPQPAATASRLGTAAELDEDGAFVLRGARQLRLSLYSLTRTLPLLPCCGATSQNPAALLTAADAAAAVVSEAAPSAGIRSIFVGVTGSAALDAVLAQLVRFTSHPPVAW